MEREVYFNEYNILMEKAIFLPFASGLLRAYAETKAIIKENYQFMPFLFTRDDPERILAQYHNPAVAAFSCSMWNINLNLEVARRVKRKFPNCLIVFGGHQVPREGIEFLKQYPFIDITVRGEGEEVFAKILLRALESQDWAGISATSYRTNDSIIRNDEEYPLAKDLDIFPSPYLEGLYDYLFDRSITLQPIIETNRGCPFHCSFCYWSGENIKLRFFSLDRVKQILDWCGVHKMEFVLCADANFGIAKRDLEVAKYVVETKRKYGYPKIFRACYGKNTEETMFQIGKLLNEHKLTKAISMARQSNNPVTLKNIKRQNIRMAVYDSLQRRYNEAGIPTSIDIILGLPGETYESFVTGIEEVLEADFKSQLLIYPLQVYPNTELSQPAYRERFQIKTVTLPLNEVHASAHKPSDITECEEIVVSTNTMSVDEWKKAMVFIRIAQLLHSLKLGFFVSVYLFDRYGVSYTQFYEYIATLKGRSGISFFAYELASYADILEAILQGKPRGCLAPDFSSTYWEVEEASYLKISTCKYQFYDELYFIAKEYLDSLNIAYDAEELWDVILYQRTRVPNLYSDRHECHFQYNIPEYFDKYFTSQRCRLRKSPQLMLVGGKDYNGDKQAFAREVLLYGRKSEAMFYPVKGEKHDRPIISQP